MVFGWRSFETYPLATRAVHATPIPVPLTGDHVYDLDAMAAAVTDRTRLIFVCNPNNPTGTVVDADDLRTFLRKVPSDVVVALDEAYFEYMRLGPARHTTHWSCGASSPTWWCCAPSRRRTDWPACVGLRGRRPQVVTALRKVHVPFSGHLALAARRDRLPGRRRRAADPHRHRRRRTNPGDRPVA